MSSGSSWMWESKLFNSPLSRLVAAFVVFFVLAPVVLAPATGAATQQSDRSVTLLGGGWGHGIGMSQYGAFGRAEAGHSYEEILGFYYDNTTIATIADLKSSGDGTIAIESDDVDVDVEFDDLVDVRVAIAESLVLGPPTNAPVGWEITVVAADSEIGSATTSVSVAWDESSSRWSARTEQDGTNVDLCASREECRGNPLEFILGDEQEIVLTKVRRGGRTVYFKGKGRYDSFGHYRAGSIVLHPAEVAGPKGQATTECGSARSGQFCVIHGRLDMQQYLYGIDEVPLAWPMESLKAQAVAARSYALAKTLARQSNKGWKAPFDVYESVKDQNYIGWKHGRHCIDSESEWCEAVDATSNEIVVYRSDKTGQEQPYVVEAFYSSSNGGHTSEPRDVWANGKDLPYLRAKPDPYDNNTENPNNMKAFVYPVAQLSSWLNNYQASRPEQAQLKVGTVKSVTINAPASGRVSFAEVIIEGSDKTATMMDRYRCGPQGSSRQLCHRSTYGDGQGHYGYRFYNAIWRGCSNTAGCSPLKSSNFRVLTFNDLQAGTYYYDPVIWLLGERLTTGTSETTFSPDEPITRGQFATFLWRFAGKPTAELDGTLLFSDVEEDAYFTEPVRWLTDTGITTGTSETTFSPDEPITRGQFATFLWRFAGKPTAELDGTLLFSDVEEDAYFTEPVRWLTDTGITTGTSETTFSPDALVTRGQFATFLWRFAGKPEALGPDAAIPPHMRDYAPSIPVRAEMETEEYPPDDEETDADLTDTESSDGEAISDDIPDANASDDTDMTD